MSQNDVEWYMSETLQNFPWNVQPCKGASECNKYIGNPLCTIIGGDCLTEKAWSKAGRKQVLVCQEMMWLQMDGKMWTETCSKGTRCTLAFDNFYYERLMIVADGIKAGLMHCEWE